MQRNRKMLLLASGLVAVLTGCVWIGQGTGYFPYPPQSFMVNEMSWAYGGAVLAVAGLIAVAAARHVNRNARE